MNMETSVNVETDVIAQNILIISEELRQNLSLKIALMGEGCTPAGFVKNRSVILDSWDVILGFNIQGWVEVISVWSKCAKKDILIDKLLDWLSWSYQTGMEITSFEGASLDTWKIRF